MSAYDPSSANLHAPAPVTRDRAAASPGALVPVTVAHGDGIGPEIMRATLAVLAAAGARLAIEEVHDVGERTYLAGHTSGIGPSLWESLRRTRVFLKAPITTPRGGGFKSLNVTTRKTLGLYANVRPCVAYHPFVATRHPGMDVVIVRENEEDLYAGIEHRQTADVVQCLKLVTRPGCERVARYAFEYARRSGRRKVSCFTKDNIMKLTDGLFHRVFEEVGAEYPDIAREHLIVDIGAARLADTPERFDVILAPNLYGDILSDVAAQISGSVGLGASANIGRDCAMFEAIHGSAPDIAGQDVANPSGLLLSAVMLLVHVGQPDVAARVHNAWLRTVEDGVHTADIHHAEVSRRLVGTGAFADAVIERLGLEPRQLPVAAYAPTPPPAPPSHVSAPPRPVKTLLGVDVFLDWPDASPAQVAAVVEPLAGPDFRLKMISNRGVKVYPDGFPDTTCVDHWRCRFVAPVPLAANGAGGAAVTHAQVLAVLERLRAAGLDFVKTEHLYAFDGERGYSLGQGE